MAFSRVKTLEGLHFNGKAIKNSTEVENEINSNRLQPLPQVLCDSSSQFTIALLNVRSILAKLPDIAADNRLKSASVLCFCETWLNPSQLSPVIIDDQID